MNITRHLRISGRVQGVGFRYALAAEAQAGGIYGWVRNRRDGTVEAVLQGDSQAIEKIVAWARHGPPAAQVTQVNSEAAQGEFDRPYAAFGQLPTA